MYEDFYGLREQPFDLTANPKYLFLTPKHREAWSTMQYGIEGRIGLTLLLGEAGTGKTTLVRAALDSVTNPQARVLHVVNPSLTRDEFFECLSDGFAFSSALTTSKSRFLAELHASILKRQASGGFTALIVDEAQSATDEVLEEIRLMANFETPTEKLLPVILVGQPELADRLNQPSLRQLKQRVALRCFLPPLTVQQTAAYIDARIRTAGGRSSRLFTRDAVVEIARFSHGIPRIISVICNNALISGYALNRAPVTAEIILDVCRDFDLPPAPANARATAQTAAPAPPTPVVPTGAAVPPRNGAEREPPEGPGGTLFQSHTPPKKRFSFF